MLMPMIASKGRQQMKTAKLYAVLRDCCRSGQCMKCWPFPRDPSRHQSERRIAVCQGHEWTLPKAKEVAKNWGDYNSRYVPIPHGLSCQEIEARANAVGSKA